jgi:hypothetical protein
MLLVHTYNKWNKIEYMVDKLVVLTIYYLQNSSIPETQIIHVNYIICCENKQQYNNNNMLLVHRIRRIAILLIRKKNRE